LFFFSVPWHCTRSDCEVKGPPYIRFANTHIPIRVCSPSLCSGKESTLDFLSSLGSVLAHRDLGGHDVAAGVVVRREQGGVARVFV
jgi:hypothetical protein